MALLAFIHNEKSSPSSSHVAGALVSTQVSGSSGGIERVRMMDLRASEREREMKRRARFCLFSAQFNSESFISAGSLSN